MPVPLYEILDKISGNQAFLAQGHISGNRPLGPFFEKKLHILGCNLGL